MGHDRVLRNTLRHCRGPTPPRSFSPRNAPPHPSPTADESSSGGCRFRLACWLDEMKLPLDEGLAVAKRLGAEYVWFTELYAPEGEPGQWISELTDAEVDAMAAAVADHGLKLYQICVRSPVDRFGTFHIVDAPPDGDFLREGTDFRQCATTPTQPLPTPFSAPPPF
eukprot:COSAG04_NODE_12052_length_673_cov_1.259582_1_plen_166_part_10